MIGPELATRSPQWTPDHPYVGALLALAVLYAAAGILLAWTKAPQTAASRAPTAAGRPLGAILRQPAFLVAVLAGMVGHGAMVFIMTATPISMHVIEGHGLERPHGLFKRTWSPCICRRWRRPF